MALLSSATSLHLSSTSSLLQSPSSSSSSSSSEERILSASLYYQSVKTRIVKMSQPVTYSVRAVVKSLPTGGSKELANQPSQQQRNKFNVQFAPITTHDIHIGLSLEEYTEEEFQATYYTAQDNSRFKAQAHKDYVESIFSPLLLVTKKSSKQTKNMGDAENMRTSVGLEHYSYTPKTTWARQQAHKLVVQDATLGARQRNHTYVNRIKKQLQDREAQASKLATAYRRASVLAKSQALQRGRKLEAELEKEEADQ